VDQGKIDMDEAKQELKNHFVKIGSPESMRALGKVFKF
jgi:hypothetical protein